MKERVIGEVLLVRGIEKRSGVAAMRLLPNIPLGTERYPEKVARRLRTLNTSAPGSPPPPMVLCRRALFEPLQTFDRGTRTFSAIGFQANQLRVGRYQFNAFSHADNAAPSVW